MEFYSTKVLAYMASRPGQVISADEVAAATGGTLAQATTALSAAHSRPDCPVQRVGKGAYVWSVRGKKVASHPVVTDNLLQGQEREEFQGWLIGLRSEHPSNVALARALSIHETTIGKWLSRDTVPSRTAAARARESWAAMTTLPEPMVEELWPEDFLDEKPPPARRSDGWGAYHNAKKRIQVLEEEVASLRSQLELTERQAEEYGQLLDNLASVYRRIFGVVRARQQSREAPPD